MLFDKPSRLFNQNPLEKRVEILEDNYGIKEIWESKTTATGTLTTYTGTIINQDKFIEGLYNAYVVKIEAGRPKDELAVDSNGKIVFVDSLDANGNYVLKNKDGTIIAPTPTPFAIVWQVKGKEKYLALVPEDRVLDEFEIETPVVRDGNGDIKSLNSSDNWNLQNGGLKDTNVSTAVKLSSAIDTFLNTDKKDLLGGTNEVNLNDISSMGTGTLWGLEISINGVDNTKFDVSEGECRIVDNYTDRENPTYTKVYYAGSTGNSVNLLAFTNVTFLSIDVNGNLIQNTGALSSDNERVYNTLGLLTHTSRTKIDEVANGGNIIPDSNLAIADLMTCVGSRINCDGNDFSANGTNLKVDKSLGRMYGSGINFGGSNKTSNVKTLPLITAVSFKLTGKATGPSNFVDTDLIPTDKYDPNQNGTLVDIPDGNFVNHRILVAPSPTSPTTGQEGLIFVQYGQFAYDTLKKAVDSYEQESFKYSDELLNVHTRTILSVQQGCTDLSNLKQAKFTNLGTFGAFGFKKTNNYSRFSSAINVVSGLSNERQEISFVVDGGVLYADIAKAFSYERDDISFINSDSSINTVAGDFNNGSVQVGDKIIITGSTDNNGTFTVVSKTTSKIVVSETITDESAGDDVVILTYGVGNIIYNFNEREYVLDCTTGSGVGGRARIALTEGTDIAPQENWVYVIENNDVAILQQSTTEPTGEYAMCFFAFIPSIATSTSDGFYNSRRWSDVKNLDGRGVVATILSKLRDEKPIKSGLGATITINTVPTPDSVDFTVDSGTIREIYNQTVADLQLSVDGALVINDPTTAYKKITDINEITVDSTGASLNNKYFQVICGVSLNTNGFPDKLLLLLPNGSYLSADNAFKDVDGFSNTTFPSGFESVYLLFAGVFRKQSNTWTNEALAFGVNNIDLRNKQQGATSSGTGSVSVVHNDTTGKQGGTTGEYYHLTSAEHTNLTGGSPSFGGLTITGASARSATFESTNDKIEINIKRGATNRDATLRLFTTTTEAWRLGMLDDSTNDFHLYDPDGAVNFLTADLTNDIMFSQVPLFGFGEIVGFVAKFSSTTSVDITAGWVEANGKRYLLLSNTNYSLSGLSAVGYNRYYIYIDDSASTPPTPTFTTSTTAPTKSIAKGGWYNGNDRFIGFAPGVSGSATIVDFETYVNGKNVINTCRIGDAGKFLPVLSSNQNPSGSFQTPNVNDGSDILPVMAKRALIQIGNDDSGADVVNGVALGNDSPGSIFRGRLTFKGHNSIIGQGWIVLDSSLDILISGIDTNDNNQDTFFTAYEYTR